MVREDTARIILGTWIHGKHREDIKQIPASEFGRYAPIAVQIAGGEDDMLTICRKTGFSPADVADMVADRYEVMYQSAMQDVINQNRAQWLEEHKEASVQEIMDFLNGTKRTWLDGGANLNELMQIVDGYTDLLDERKNAKTFLTGVDGLDDLTGGICAGTLTAVGARPSTGKSAFCLQVAVNVAKAGGKVMFFSLEMSDEQNMDRLVLKCSRGISQKDLRSGNLTHEQWDEVQRAEQTISELNKHLYFSQEREITAIEQLIDKYEPDLVVVDQLTQLRDSSQRFPDRRLQFSHMTAELKRISMEYSTAVWLACQLNRTANQTDTPSMDNLKESGSIEEDSDNVIILARNKDEEEARAFRRDRVINVQLAKHRAGETGEFQLKFNVQRFGFVPLEEIPPMQGFYETQNEINF